MEFVSTFSSADLMYMIVCATLFVHGVCTLNFMNSKTPFLRRIGYSVFTVGVTAAMLGPVYDVHHASVPDVLMVTGLAIYHVSRNARRLLRIVRSALEVS